MDKLVVKELIQSELNAKNLKSSLIEMLEVSNSEQIQKDYRVLVDKLGNSGASNRVAQFIIEDILK